MWSGNLTVLPCGVFLEGEAAAATLYFGLSRTRSACLIQNFTYGRWPHQAERGLGLKIMEITSILSGGSVLLAVVGKDVNWWKLKLNQKSQIRYDPVSEKKYLEVSIPVYTPELVRYTKYELTWTWGW